MHGGSGEIGVEEVGLCFALLYDRGWRVGRALMGWVLRGGWQLVGLRKGDAWA